MPSTLGWIDHDPYERERTQRIIVLFNERDSRDELGLGTIRDAIAHQLFPGTSTLYTRLRYMLFIPWIYCGLEDAGVSSADVARKARAKETALVQPLLAARELGVLGRTARGDLKRLPSSVYWAGLGSWGVRRFVGAQEQYHRAFDAIHALRVAARRRDDGDVLEAVPHTWDPGLPPPPEGFPANVSFDLRREEAEYLRERICERHPESLLAWLVHDSEPVPDVDYPWLHPRQALFPGPMRELLRHARLFAEVMAGAAVLYNLELARERGGAELVATYEAALDAWLEEIGGAEMHALVEEWSSSRFWELLLGRGFAIGERTRRFVETWVHFARQGTRAVADGAQARRMVREREQSLKGAQSRFRNRRALDQWSGAAGIGVASYRWPVTRGLLEDLSAGLAAEGGG